MPTSSNRQPPKPAQDAVGVPDWVQRWVTQVALIVVAGFVVRFIFWDTHPGGFAFQTGRFVYGVSLSLFYAFWFVMNYAELAAFKKSTATTPHELIVVRGRRKLATVLVCLQVGHFVAGYYFHSSGWSVTEVVDFLALNIAGALGLYSYFLNALAIQLPYVQWRAWMRLRGFPSKEQRAKLRVAVERAAHHDKSHTWKSLAMTLLMIGPAFLFYETYYVMPLFVAYVWVWIQARLRVSLPPFAILLSTSVKETIDLHARLSVAVEPLRVVALLDLSKSSSEDAAYYIWFDSFRTTNDDDWRFVVDILSEQASVLILDCRYATGGVMHEAGNIVASKNHYKTLFITGNNGEMPVLDALYYDGMTHELCCVPYSKSAAALRSLCVSRSTIPTPDCPTIDFVSSELRI